MSVKLRLAVLLCLAAAAFFTGAEALRSLRRPLTGLPEEIYESYAARADSARYFLRDRAGRVAVFEGRRSRDPAELTRIETGNLRLADRAMLEAGLPVVDRTELLMLLEDLGS